MAQSAQCLDVPSTDRRCATSLAETAQRRSIAWGNLLGKGAVHLDVCPIVRDSSTYFVVGAGIVDAQDQQGVLNGYERRNPG